MSNKHLNQEQLEKLTREELKTYATQQGVVFRSKDDSKTIIRKVLNHLKDVTASTKTVNVSKTVIKKKETVKTEKPVKQSSKSDCPTITLKQVGNNLILTAEGRSYTKVVKDSDKRNELKERVRSYLQEKTQGEYQHLLKIFAEVASGDIDAKKEKLKGLIEKDVTKQPEPVTPTEKKIIEDEVKATPSLPVSSERTSKRGEW